MTKYIVTTNLNDDIYVDTLTAAKKYIYESGAERGVVCNEKGLAVSAYRADQKTGKVHKIAHEAYNED